VSVLVGYSTHRLVVQGMSGSTGTFHTKQAIEYGTKWSPASRPARAA
jgi:succinyl-CoA synthetase alpha subunit